MLRAFPYALTTQNAQRLINSCLVVFHPDCLNRANPDTTVAVTAFCFIRKNNLTRSFLIRHNFLSTKKRKARRPQEAMDSVPLGVILYAEGKLMKP